MTNINWAPLRDEFGEILAVDGFVADGHTETGALRRGKYFAYRIDTQLSGDAAQIDGQEVEVFEDVVIGHLLHPGYEDRLVVDPDVAAGVDSQRAVVKVIPDFTVGTAVADACS